MPDNEDYRSYLEEKFKGLQSAQHGYFNTVHDKLDAIEKQTTKTNNRVTKLEDDLTEYRMIKKYPKIFIGIVAFSVILFIYGFAKIIQKQNVFQVTQDGLKTQVDMINTPIKDTRSGKTYLYPSGLLIDSIIKDHK